MVREQFKLSINESMSPVLRDCFIDREEFSVRCRVVKLSAFELFREVLDCIPLTLHVLLEDRPNSELGGICEDPRSSLWIP